MAMQHTEQMAGLVHRSERMPQYAVVEVLRGLFIPCKASERALEPFVPVPGCIRVLPNLGLAWEYLSEIDD